MCAVGPVRRQRELEVTGQLQPARFARSIHQSHAADFPVVFRGDDNFRDGLAWSTPPPELRFVRRETPYVTALRRSHRLMGVAPDNSAFQIPDITNRARHIAGRIGYPAPHDQIQPAYLAAARPCYSD